MSQMKAIAVTQRGGIDNLQAIQVPKPSEPQGHDLLVKVYATSLNPIDTKVRAGTYDDYPDYFSHCPQLPQILGFDGSGTIVSRGSLAAPHFTPGTPVYYTGSPVRQGANAEYQLIDSRGAAIKPQSLDFIEAAALPLTWLTAWEALVERLGIQEGEDAGLLIVNGAGGVGSVASQIAREILKLPLVVSTASREETVRFSKAMGATHTVSHREDIVQQVRDLKLEKPIRYVLITHTPTAGYLEPAATIVEPMGKVCSIVQEREMDKMYGTEFMSKSLTYVWALVGTKPYYGVDVESHGRILEQLARWIDEGKIKCHLQQKLPLTADGLRRAHEIIEGGKAVGKVGVGIGVDGLKEEHAFS
ncbi:MAG: hypothetical protein M1820_009331 [Bogoriella megaspora]|nr:MAG: hypothetical protein M1820_009331 [Bogoriella megaspora]